MNNNRENGEGQAVQAWRTDLSVPYSPGRATRVASWIGWHFLELSGVTVPAVLAVAVTPWAWVVSGVIGAGWTAHGIRTAKEQAQIKQPSAKTLRRASEEHRSDVDDTVDDTADGPAPDVDSNRESGVSGGSKASGGVA